MRLRPADGSVITIYKVGKDPISMLFDGISMWSANFGSDRSKALQQKRHASHRTATPAAT